MSCFALQVGFICTVLAYLPSCIVSCIKPVGDEDDELPGPTPPPPIYSLNDDVLYYLATYTLPIGDGAAFVLTCKSIYDAAGGKMVLRELKDQPVVIRAQFLERLEVDFPKRILCHRCATFHSRYKKSPKFIDPEISECDRASGSIRYAPQRYTLHYRQAKEIVNRLLFGPSYGRDLHQLMVQGPFTESIPHEEILTAYHHELKWVKKNGTYALLIRRNIRVEYEYTSVKSRRNAAWGIHAGSHHVWAWYTERHMVEEQPLQCYRCEDCGAERQYSITRLPHKPGYAVFRSTLWESVGLCKNSGYDLWNHICAPHIGRNIPISPRDLEHQHAFIDNIPSILAKDSMIDLENSRVHLGT